MAIVQSSKTAGSITVSATSPGLAPATATIAAKAVKLRPQVDPWEREIPSGEGVSGLWRPAAPVAAAQSGNPMALATAAADMIFTLRQSGNALTGSVESSGGGGMFGGGSPGGPIEEGKVEGGKISFRSGTTTYTGTVSGEQIELQRSAPPGRRPGGGQAAPATAGPRPAIGPPPGGTDPSFGAGFGGGRGGAQPAPLVLKRAKR
jgi:beta-galactosidase